MAVRRGEDSILGEEGVALWHGKELGVAGRGQYSSCFGCKELLGLRRKLSWGRVLKWLAVENDFAELP